VACDEHDGRVLPPFRVTQLRLGAPTLLCPELKVGSSASLLRIMRITMGRVDAGSVAVKARLRRSPRARRVGAFVDAQRLRRRARRRLGRACGASHERTTPRSGVRCRAARVSATPGIFSDVAQARRVASAATCKADRRRRGGIARVAGGAGVSPPSDGMAPAASGCASAAISRCGARGLHGPDASAPVLSARAAGHHARRADSSRRAAAARLRRRSDSAMARPGTAPTVPEQMTAHL
jgi:hypothetical protein